MPEARREAGTDKEEVPEAGPGTTVLLEDQRQLEGGHHTGIVHYAVQLLAGVLQLQVDVQHAATQAAGLARWKPQHIAGYPPGQFLGHQHFGAVQFGLFGPW